MLPQDGPSVKGVLQLAPSLTGAVGYISKRSLELVKAFRELSPRSYFVLVSGARVRRAQTFSLCAILATKARQAGVACDHLRQLPPRSPPQTSTVIQRLPWLPAADAVVSENGGRIFLRDPAGAPSLSPTCHSCPVQSDLLGSWL